MIPELPEDQSKVRNDLIRDLAHRNGLKADDIKIVMFYVASAKTRIEVRHTVPRPERRGDDRQVR